MKVSLLVSCFWLLGLAGLIAAGGCGGGGIPQPTTGASGASGGGTTGSTGATGPNSLLNGKYAFSFTGAATQTGHPLFMTGSFTADGTGHITAGEEDINEVAIGASKGLALTGSYAIGTDGRGTLNFTGVVTQTFKIVVETGNHGQLIRFDTGASGSGTFDLQTASAFSLSSLQGRFVFDWNGTDESENPLSAIGALAFSSAGAATGAADLNQAGSNSQATVTATFQAPDANGRGTASISYGSSTIGYAYDVVSASRILLIEVDTVAATVGEADAQSSSATSSTSSLAGNYAFFLNGINQGVVLGGQVVADGNGNITSSDVTENSGFTVIEAPFVGNPTYVAANTVQGVTVNGRFTMTATEPSQFADTFVVYLISSSQALIMETDSDQITFGQITSQSGAPFSSASLNGNYGLNLTGIDGQGAEVDFVGQFSASGTSTLAGGTVDINDQDLSPSTFPNSALSGGSYSVVNATTGHTTITFAAAGATLAFSTYFVSPNLSLWVETDNNFISGGTSQSQPAIP